MNRLPFGAVSSTSDERRDIRPFAIWIGYVCVPEVMLMQVGFIGGRNPSTMDQMVG